MKQTLQLFALARDLAGSSVVELEVPEAATIRDLRRALIERVPALGGLERHLMFAMDADYVADATLIEPGSELACFPPVSGG